MIVVTGAAGFIGSNVVADLEAEDRGPIVVSDWFGAGEKWRNLAKRSIAAFVAPEDLIGFLDMNRTRVRAIIHMGAISSTTERDVDRLLALNVRFTVSLWDWCAARGVPFIYASSAAVYGGRESGFTDDDTPAGVACLRPLNAYGWSKKAVDEIFVHRRAAGDETPPQWVGLRFFNVYGPNEYHKADMKSVAVKLFDGLASGSPYRLFKSYREGIADGCQRRDFVYVKDCTKVVSWFLDHPGVSGIFNLGTGRARSFLDIAAAMERALGRRCEVEFADMPAELREKYQYFTEADMAKSRGRGMSPAFTSLEDGVGDYVSRYLSRGDRYR